MPYKQPYHQGRRHVERDYTRNLHIVRHIQLGEIHGKPSTAGQEDGTSTVTDACRLINRSSVSVYRENQIYG